MLFIAVQPQEIEIAKSKGKILVEPSEKKDDEDSEEQIIPVQTQTAHVKKEKVEESKEKASPDKNQNQDITEDTRRNSQTPPNPMYDSQLFSYSIKEFQFRI